MNLATQKCSNTIVEWAILKHQWRNRDRLLLWPLAAILLLSGVLLALKFLVL